MPRIRTVKPEFFSHQGLASCSPHARLLAIAVLQMADSQGRFEYIPMQLHAHAFPWEAEVKIPSLLGELEGIGYLFQYVAGGKSLIQVQGFTEHQRLGGKEAQMPSKYPEYKGEKPSASPGSTESRPVKQVGAQEQGTGNREREQGIQTTSDAGASDLRKQAWDEGVALMGSSSRSLIGKAIKDHGHAEVAKAIAATKVEGAADPKAYFLRCLPKKGWHIAEDLGV